VLFVAIKKRDENPQGMGIPSALIGEILSRKAAKTAKIAHLTRYKTDSLRALRLGEKLLFQPQSPVPVHRHSAFL